MILARGSASDVRQRVEKGATLLLWGDAAAAELEREGIPFRTPADVLDPGAEDAADDAAILWTKEWGRRPMVDGRSFRELLEWKGVSLWWFAELFLHHSTGAPQRVRTIETFHRLLEALSPSEVEAIGLATEDETLLGRTCNARGVLFHGPRKSGRRGFGPALGISLRSRWNTVKTFASALKAWVSGAPEPQAFSGRRVLFLSHAAFWRTRTDSSSGEPREYEHYFDRLIPEVDKSPGLQAFVVAVGPRAAFRRRSAKDRMADWAGLHEADGRYVPVNRFTSLRVFRETLRGTREARRAFRSLRRSPGAHEAFSYRGVAFADLSGEDLAGTLLLQLPWAIRSYEETVELLATVQPAALCLYAESSGWGRAALAAARAAGVRSLAIQHGILYPKYYSYIHAPDEAECPLPDRTAVFGEAARRLLVDLGRYRPESLSVTGSPKFDELLRSASPRQREALRTGLGVPRDERLVLVASRFRGIRQTHQSIGSAFLALVRAVEALPGVTCLVKPHPAEPAAPYESVIRASGARRTRVLSPSADFVELILAADALVTVESLAAVEALVLDRPVLVLNMPTNLREMVDLGVALGVARGEDPGPPVHDLLFDAEIRGRLEAARRLYLSDVAHGVDGRATERILALVREVAGA